MWILRAIITHISHHLLYYITIYTNSLLYNLLYIYINTVEHAVEDDTVRVSFVVAYKNRRAGSGRFHLGGGGSGNSELKKTDKYEYSALEEMLQDAQESLSQISKEIDFARRQETLLLEAGNSMESRIQVFGWLSMIILLTTSLWQLVYLRHFFTSKKLL